MLSRVACGKERGEEDGVGGGPRVDAGPWCG
jgi:hypothetical protein